MNQGWDKSQASLKKSGTCSWHSRFVLCCEQFLLFLFFIFPHSTESHGKRRLFLEKLLVTVHSLIFWYFLSFFTFILPLKIFVCKEHFTIPWGLSVHTAYSVLAIVINLTLVSFSPSNRALLAVTPLGHAPLKRLQLIQHGSASTISSNIPGTSMCAGLSLPSKLCGRTGQGVGSSLLLDQLLLEEKTEFFYTKLCVLTSLPEQVLGRQNDRSTQRCTALHNKKKGVSTQLESAMQACGHTYRPLHIEKCEVKRDQHLISSTA